LNFKLFLLEEKIRHKNIQLVQYGIVYVERLMLLKTEP